MSVFSFPTSFFLLVLFIVYCAGSNKVAQIFDFLTNLITYFVNICNTKVIFTFVESGTISTTIERIHILKGPDLSIN